MQPVPATEIELQIGDGDYLCALKLPQLAELQTKCGAGLLTIYADLMSGRYVMGAQAVGVPHEGRATTDQVYETIRLGLIGGGQGIVNGSPVKVNAIVARQIMDGYVYPVPFEEAWSIAVAIIAAKVVGYTPPKAAPAVGPAKPPRKRKRRAPGETASI